MIDLTVVKVVGNVFAVNGFLFAAAEHMTKLFQRGGARRSFYWLLRGMHREWQVCETQKDFAQNDNKNGKFVRVWRFPFHTPWNG